MGVKRFEDLEIFKKARVLSKEIYSLAAIGNFARDFGLKGQIEKASVSVLSNIAEGFERKSNPDFVRFLYMAKGSCGEVRAQLMVALDQKYIDEKTYKEQSSKYEVLSAMIGKLIAYLCENDMYKK